MTFPMTRRCMVYLVSVTVLALIAASVEYDSYRTKRSRDLTTMRLGMIAEIEGLLSDLKDVQRSAAGYQGTRDERYLVGYDQAIREAGKHQAAIGEHFDEINAGSFGLLQSDISTFVRRMEHVVDEARWNRTHPSDGLRDETYLEAIEKKLQAVVSSQRDSATAEQRNPQSRAMTLRVVRLILGPLALISIMIAAYSQRRHVFELSEARQEIASANGRLTESCNELQTRSSQIALLADMSEVLQISADLDETKRLLPGFGARLFPNTTGAAYVFGGSKDTLEILADWGLHPRPQSFEKDQCWALRLSRTHATTPDDTAPVCTHGQHADRYAVCVPLSAQGETLGVLHLCAPPETPVDTNLQFFAKTVADHVSLAIANLRLQETLRAKAVRDPLTGLFNRRHMEESLERELSRARRRSTRLGLMIVDVDHFKNYNDTYGHPGGDALLEHLAETMRSQFRQEDVVCRFGGEEFVVIFPDVTEEALIARAEQLRLAAQSMKVYLGGQTLGRVTISAGVALWPDHASEKDLVAVADAALYEAKRSGRDRVVSAGAKPSLKVVPA